MTMKLKAPRGLAENSNKLRYLSITLEQTGTFTHWSLNYSANSLCGDTLQERLAMEIDNEGFHTGVFDFNNHFHRTPIQIGHVLFDKITAHHNDPGWDDVARI